MGLSEHFPKERWRRLGILNVSSICSCGVILFIGLISLTFSRPGSTIMEARILFHGECTTSNNLDLFLQLIINLFSTCILASSNFFMQIVSSPTRQEIDHAHRSLHPLEVGVFSLKNLGSLSWFKILAWVGLFLSSIPIHLLFNSAIYSIDYQGSDWYLTIATQGFVDQTVDYFVPGASLAAAGSSCPAAPDGTHLNCTDPEFSIWEQGRLIWAGAPGFGQDANIRKGHWNESLAKMNITKAAQNSSSWELLTTSDCFDQYRFCKPRQRYRDLVVVVDELPGWTRSEVYNFTGSAASNLSQFWDPQIPPNRLNSLWYSTPCRDWKYGNSWANEYPELCGSSSPEEESTGCSGALGEPNGFNWINSTRLQDSWRISFFRHINISIPAAFGYDIRFNDFTVKHCMAELNPEYACKLGLAPPLLLIVIGCVFVKSCLCAAVLFRLTRTSLVTPGDALASFISQPDPNTARLATMSLADADRLEYKSIEAMPISGLVDGPSARKWKPRSARFKSVLSRAVWMRTYSVLTCGIALLATGLGLVVSDNGASTLIGTFGKSMTINIVVHFSYLGALLAANMPQLILSLCYCTLNSFLTRIQAEKEWNSYSRCYKPLRVSDPKGEQVSNYRLQLPYKYSIPLISISIILHWICSSTIFLNIIEGGFWTNREQLDENSITAGFGVSDNSYVAVGVSGSAMLTLFVISTILYISLELFSLRRVPGDMVCGGTNTLVLSAACHTLATTMRNKSLSTRQNHAASRKYVTERSTSTDASSISRYPQESSAPGIDIDSESSRPPGEPSITPSAEVSTSLEQQQEVEEDEEQLLSGVVAEDDERALLEEVAMSKVRWGVIPANPGTLEDLVTDEVVLHLGFGTEDHNVQPPCEGRLYI